MNALFVDEEWLDGESEMELILGRYGIREIALHMAFIKGLQGIQRWRKCCTDQAVVPRPEGGISHT